MDEAERPKKFILPEPKRPQKSPNWGAFSGEDAEYDEHAANTMSTFDRLYLSGKEKTVTRNTPDMNSSSSPEQSDGFDFRSALRNGNDPELNDAWRFNYREPGSGSVQPARVRSAAGAHWPH